MSLHVLDVISGGVQSCFTSPRCRCLLLTFRRWAWGGGAEVTPIADYLGTLDSFPGSSLFDPILQVGTGGGGGCSWTRLVGSGISPQYLAKPGIQSQLPIQ